MFDSKLEEGNTYTATRTTKGSKFGPGNVRQITFKVLNMGPMYIQVQSPEGTHSIERRTLSNIRRVF